MHEEIEVTRHSWWTKRSKVVSKYILSYYFYIFIILSIPLAIIQIRFSEVYEDRCTIDDRIILYLLVIGIIQLIYSFNGILLIIFSLLYEKYRWLSIIHLICFGLQPILLISFFAWFIIGNYLVFHIKDEVQYTNTYDVRTYCDSTLYQMAFWVIITYYIILIFFSVCFLLTHMKYFIEQLKTYSRKSSDADSCKV